MIVYDKNTFGSNREIDEVNGYLRVDECNISKCQVRPYLGREIPNWREFDLEPDKIYNVYCPREELKKAVPTFNNLPLTREHIEVDVDNVPKEKIVGSLGDHASFEYPYLKNNLIIYDKKDIDLVMSGKKKELSCGYRYTPVRQSGEADGQHYDFVMTDIVGNHVALVKQGRAGRDVMVADSSKGILETIKEKIMAVFDNDLVGDEFKESEHPRDKDGKFTTAGGSGSSLKDDKDVENYWQGSGSKESQGAGVVKVMKKQLEDLKAEHKKIFGKPMFVSKEEQERGEMIGKQIKDLEDEIAKKESEGSEKKDAGSTKSSVEPKIKNYLKEKITGWYKNAKQDYDVDGEFLGVEEKENSSGGKDLVIKYKEDGKELKSTIGWYKEYTPEQMYDIWMELGADDDMTGDKKLDKKQEKVNIVMKEFKDGELKSGSGEKVTDPKQAIAIALSEADKVAKDKEIPEKQDEPEKAGDDKALNKGEKKMADEVKETPAEEKVTEDACKKAEDKEVKPACDEKEDKRKLIDEIGGILKDKLSEEEWRTVIKKAEELAYNDSEASADDEDKKDLKGKEKKAFAEGVVYGEEKEKAEPKKLDSEHESEGMKKAEEKKEEKAEDKKMAKDEALVMDADAIKAEAKAEVIADFKARETARRAVRKMVGDVDVFAFDSAEEIYKFACEKAGMDLNEIVSFKDAFKGLSLNKSKLAMDASPVSGSDVECFKDIRLT